MTTATARKTALENKHLRNCDYLRLSYLVLAKQATTGLVCAPLNEIQRIRDLQLYAQVVIRTVNVVILRCCFAEDGTDLFISACCTCSTLIFPPSTNQILICGVITAICRRRC